MAVKKANPMLTKNGKPRLGPLNINQLKDLVEKSQRNKDKTKYQRELTRKEKLLQK